MGKNPQVVGHWHTLIESFATSSLDFYKLVTAGIALRKIPNLTVSRVEWQESGLGSGKRVYLRVSREGLNFDICAAPFGTGYFFSWWLARIPRILLDFAVLFGIAIAGLICLSIASRQDCSGILMAPIMFFGLLFGAGFLVRYGDLGWEPIVLSMPITGFLYGFVFRPTTYFNEDTALMFRESVHHAVLEAIDQVTSAQGVRGLSEEARKVTFKPGGKET
jgi:hypothetical protein